MWSWFGGGQKKSSATDAIVTLRTHLDMLSKKERHTEQLIDEQDAIARKNVTTNKALARTALKRKKTLSNELEKLQGQIESMNAQANALENANLNHETMKAMHAGAKAMKHIHGNMDIDKVDATMDEVRDQVSLGEEIRDAISRPLGQEVDEDELNDELEELEQEQLDNKMLGAGKAPAHNLPTHNEPVAANKDKAEEEDDEEEELRKLQAEMAM